MSETRDLLIEIGTEELPPKALSRLSAAFAEGVTAGLEAAALQAQNTIAYAAPRRLALLINAVSLSPVYRGVLLLGATAAACGAILYQLEEEARSLLLSPKKLYGLVRSGGLAS